MPENEERLRMLYTAAAVPDRDHLQEGDWERLVCGELAVADREKALDHVTRCAECARIYRGIDALTEGARAFDPGVPAAGASRARVLAFPRYLWLGGLAAAAALALVLLRPAAGPSVTAPGAGDGFRGTSTRDDPAPLAPRGSVAGTPGELRWKGIATPALYRVVVLDGEGEPVWSSADVEGTVMAWPAGLELKPGSYFWQVIALPKGGLPGDRRASPLAAFELVTSSRR
jgi:hypothetical protein